MRYSITAIVGCLRKLFIAHVRAYAVKSTVGPADNKNQFIFRILVALEAGFKCVLVFESIRT